MGGLLGSSSLWVALLGSCPAGVLHHWTSCIHAAMRALHMRAVSSQYCSAGLPHNHPAKDIGLVTDWGAKVMHHLRLASLLFALLSCCTIELHFTCRDDAPYEGDFPADGFAELLHDWAAGPAPHAGWSPPALLCWAAA